MQILNKTQQIRLKLNNLDELIKYNSKLRDLAYDRYMRKLNWVFFSFIFTSSEDLRWEWENKRNIVKELNEYRNIISNMLLKGEDDN
jgi:GAF domain-containing protein